MYFTPNICLTHIAHKSKPHKAPTNTHMPSNLRQHSLYPIVQPFDPVQALPNHKHPQHLTPDLTPTSSPLQNTSWAFHHRSPWHMLSDASVLVASLSLSPGCNKDQYGGHTMVQYSCRLDAGELCTEGYLPMFE